MFIPRFNAPHRIAPSPPPTPGMTRAKEIQRLLDLGYSQIEIADALGMRRVNVNDYIQRYSLRITRPKS